MNKLRLLPFFLFAYLLSVGFTDILHMPEPGAKIRVPELVFLMLAMVWVGVFYRQLPRMLQPGPLEWAILAYIASVFLAAAAHPEVRTWTEALAMLYLYGVLVIYKTSLHLIPDPEGWITKAFKVTGLLAASLGIAGFTLYLFDTPNSLVVPSDCYYGYFGEMIRAVGLMVTPNMLHNFLGICMLVYLPGYLNNANRKVHHHLILLVLLTAILLTISKDIFLLAAAVLFLLTQVRILKRERLGWKLASLMLFMFCMIGTHFLVEKKLDYATHLTMEQGCYEKNIRFEAGPFVVRFTNYTTNKIAAIRAGLEKIPFGIGPGNFNDYVGKLKTMDLYPTYFINFDPHCTYTGAFGELGIIGLLALLYMIYQIARSLLTISNQEEKRTGHMFVALNSCFLFMAMEAMILDTLHFRYVWILLGILAFLLERKNQNLQNRPH